MWTKRGAGWGRPLGRVPKAILRVVSKFGDYRNSDGISSEGKSSDYFKKKISVSANSVSIFWALKYIESKLSD